MITSQLFLQFPFGGDKRDRTADLLNAIQALSQLSYTPRYKEKIFSFCLRDLFQLSASHRLPRSVQGVFYQKGSALSIVYLKFFSSIFFGAGKRIFTGIFK